MNIDKLKERSSQKQIIKDIVGKEVYLGDMIIIPTSSTTLKPVMIIQFNPKSLKCVDSKGNVFNCFSQFVKITSFYDSVELQHWEELKAKYFKEKEDKKANEVKTAFINTFFYDKSLDKYGIMDINIKSKPGKNINISDIKEQTAFLNNFTDKDFYIFTKDYNFISFKDITFSNILLSTEYSFNHKYRFKFNTFYYITKSNIKNEVDLTNIKNFEKEDNQYRSHWFMVFSPRDYKYIFSTDSTLTEDSIYFFFLANYTISQQYKNSYNYSLILEDKLDKIFK